MLLMSFLMWSLASRYAAAAAALATTAPVATCEVSIEAYELQKHSSEVTERLKHTEDHLVTDVLHSSIWKGER